MGNSIFIFLNDEVNFKSIFEKYLQFENHVLRTDYESVLNKSRIIIEELFKIIIDEDHNDKMLFGAFYSKTPFKTIFYKFFYKKCISSNFYYKLESSY